MSSAVGADSTGSSCSADMDVFSSAVGRRTKSGDCCDLKISESSGKTSGEKIETSLGVSSASVSFFSVKCIGLLTCGSASSSSAALMASVREGSGTRNSVEAFLSSLI